jgi:hypothetical protein
MFGQLLVGDLRAQPQRDVQRMIAAQLRPRLMIRPSTLALRGPAGPTPLATAPEQILLHVMSPRPPRHGVDIAIRRAAGKMKPHV